MGRAGGIALPPRRHPDEDRAVDAFELATVAAAHPTVPDGYRDPARGVIVNVEVDDVDERHRRMIIDGGLPELLPLRSEAFGQRHFITAAPGNVMVDVITPIPPTGEFAAAFS
jgi:hypothetical protein